METRFNIIGNYFALDKDTGKIRHINDVQSGLKCNCICPECHDSLVARKGDKRTHHFAHASSSDATNKLCCLGETIIHMLGKEVIREASAFYLPSQSYKDCNMRNDINAKNIAFKGIHKLSINKDNWIVNEEQTDSISGFIPDITLSNDKNNNENNKIWVEIKRTHGIDENKARYIIENEIPTIEVDLSDDSLFEGLDGVDDLKKRIREIIITQNDSPYLEWFYLPVAYKRIINNKLNEGDACFYSDVKCNFNCDCCIASDAKCTKKYCIYDPEAVEKDNSKVSALLRHISDVHNNFADLFVQNNKQTEDYNTLTIYGLLNTIGIRSKVKNSLREFLVHNGRNACVISQDDEYKDYGVIVFNKLKMILQIKNKCTLEIPLLTQVKE